MNSKITTAAETNHTSETKRYDYLDNIKWVLTIIVILFHSALGAIPGGIDFSLPFVNKSMYWQYDMLDDFTGICASFFMSLFFFISAYFVIPSFNRKGAGRFILDKLKRLGIPVLLAIFIITPLMWNMSTDKHYSYLDALYRYGTMLKTGNIYLNVTWFCWALIVFNVVFALIQKLRSSTEQKSIEKKFPEILKIVLIAIIMIPFNYLGLYLQDLLGKDFLGFRLLSNFPTYIFMFYLGIQTYKNHWIEQITFKHAFFGIIMWVFGYVFIFEILKGYGYNGYAMAKGFTVIGICMFLIYVFKTLFNSKNKWTIVLSRTAFAAYVIQKIPMAFIAYIYTPHMTQTPFVNFIVIAIPSVALSFLIGYVICKLPILNRIF